MVSGGTMPCAPARQFLLAIKKGRAAPLAAMKPSAFLINLARGPIAEEQALYRALRRLRHRRSGAGHLVALSER